MTVIEPRTSGFGSDRSTNWATTTALISNLFAIDFVQSTMHIVSSCPILNSIHANELKGGDILGR